MNASPLYAAVARAATTPPLGMYLIGYADRTGGAQSVRDELTATALVLDDGHSRVVLIALDILGLNWEVVGRVKAAIERSTAIPGDHVLINCSHTHSGPVGYAYPDRRVAYTLRELGNRLLLIPTGAQPGGWRFNQRYIDGLVEKLVSITQQAVGDLAPAELAWGQGEAHIGHNRRERKPNGTIEIGHNPDGPIDRSVTVLRAMRGKEPIATLVNFACHGTILGPTSYAISADWIGAMRRHVEAQIGGLCLFFQGAAGDINPQMEWTADDYPEVVKRGTEVGAEVVRIAANLQPVSSTPIRARKATVWLRLVLPETSEGKSTPTYRQRLHELTGAIPEILVDPLLETRYPWKTVCEWREGVPYTPVEVSAVRLGDVVLGAVSMEPFTEIGLAVKHASPAPVTLFGGYTNGLTGYLPTASEHALGGYEVEMAPYFYRLPGILASDSGTRVVEALNGLMKDLYT